VDIRVVAATNKDLAAEAAAGRFRQDLWYRLRVVEIPVPPLRDRVDDVLPLAESFLKRFGGERLSFTDEARAALVAHRWPGNVRELRNAVERAVVVCEGRRVGPEHLPLSLGAGGTGEEPIPTLEEVERAHIALVLRVTDGNVLAAAKVLGIARNTLYARIERYGLGGLRGRNPDSEQIDRSITA
jgi:two-component system response regulator HydG